MLRGILFRLPMQQVLCCGSFMKKIPLIVFLMPVLWLYSQDSYDAYYPQEYETPVGEAVESYNGYETEYPSEENAEAPIEIQVQEPKPDLTEEELKRIIQTLNSRQPATNLAPLIEPGDPNFDIEAALKRFHSTRTESLKKTLYQPYEQFLYHKDQISGTEILGFRTNLTTFYNKQGVYQLSFWFKKTREPLVKPAYCAVGTLKLLVFSKKRFVSYDTGGQIIKLTLFGTNNRQSFVKDFAFDLNAATFLHYEKGISVLELNKTIDAAEARTLRNLFRGNTYMLGRVEGQFAQYDFAFRQDALFFYRTFFEYAYNNRYYQ